MKFIKIILRDKRSITLPIEKAEKILDSQSQLIKILDDEGQWTGQTLNKSEIVWTERDKDEERDWKRDNTTALPEHKQTPEEMKHISKLFKTYKPNWMKDENPT